MAAIACRFSITVKQKLENTFCAILQSISCREAPNLLNRKVIFIWFFPN